MSTLAAVIGLEVHAQLKTRSKLFCGCPVEFGAEPNSRVCPVCLGLPGALPVPNREAVRLAVRFAKALAADVHLHSLWARKNYFYPDLPKGYQISQFDHPLATGGQVRIDLPDGAQRWIGVTRMHLEEDAGKSVHEGFPAGQSGVDLNRCGVPLIEIVGEPEIHTPLEAYLYLERLRSVLRATGVCEAEMEKGTLRCDANVSVHQPGEPWGTRVEIKNLNSIRHVRRALTFEIDRQIRLIDAGGDVEQETRLWNDATGETRPMRSKEEAHDYRYFPDPDLLPLILSPALVEEAGADLPELPHVRRDRFQQELGLSEADAHRLTVEFELADFFEQTVSAGARPRQAANWVLSELLGRLNDEGLTITASPIPPARLAEIVGMVEEGRISGKVGKQVFDECWRTGADPAAVVEAKGLRQVTDEAELLKVCREVLADHPHQVETWRRGKTQVRGFLVGQVMRRTRGTAQPELVNRIIETLLAE